MIKSRRLLPVQTSASASAAVVAAWVAVRRATAKGSVAHATLIHELAQPTALLALPEAYLALPVFF